MMDEELRRKSGVDVESADIDLESVRTVSVAFAHPNTHRTTKLSMNSVLPAIELSWHGITVKPKSKSKSLVSSICDTFSVSDKLKLGPSPERNYILNNVFGVAYPGEVLAIMGASGAGKTSLLNVLTQRNMSEVRPTGYIRLNGYDIDRKTLRLISAYVEQDDLFIGTMTVIEHLRFMALLRMGKKYTYYEREKRIQNVLTELGLTHIANSTIGWPHRLKGISGGERKRLAFASEIMTGPPVLFCDEPTSGLDSYLAQQVIQVLKQLAHRKNMTIIITIHQPSSQVFEMFDKICLMADGRLAFLGKAEEALEMWKGIGYPIPSNFNPGDHFVSTLAVESERSCRSRNRIKKICDTFLESSTGRQLYVASQNSSSNGSGDGGSGVESLSISLSSDDAIWCSGEEGFMHKDFRSYKATWWQQFGVLTKRSFFVTLREPMLLKVRLVQTVFISLLLGVIYFNTPIRQTTVMNINGLLFQAVANMNFMFQFSSVNTFCEELPVFMREQLGHLYRVDAFFLAKNVAELAQYLLYPIIFSSIVYWMSGFVREFDAFLLFTLSCVMITNIAISSGYAASCIFGDVNVANAVMPVIVVPLLAFGGFYINQESLPFYFYPLKYLSYFGYAFESTAINQWTRIDSIPGCNSSMNQTTISPTMNSGCYRDGKAVLDSLSFQVSDLLFDYIAMLVMIVGLRVIAFVALSIRASLKK